MFDLSSFPLPKGAILGGALYAVLSIAGGQVIGPRLIEAAGWLTLCETDIQAEISARGEPKARLPSTECDSLIGRFHPELMRLCIEFGNPDLGGPGAGAAREAEQRARELERQRLVRAAAEAGSRCECAARVYTRDRFLALGVYAGSARTWSLPAIDDMPRELNVMVESGLCAGELGADQ